MKHVFTADVREITEGMPLEAWSLPSALVHAEGLSGNEVKFALHGAARRDAGELFGRRIRVTIETID